MLMQPNPRGESLHCQYFGVLKVDVASIQVKARLLADNRLFKSPFGLLEQPQFITWTSSWFIELKREETRVEGKVKLLPVDLWPQTVGRDPKNEMVDTRGANLLSPKAVP